MSEVVEICITKKLGGTMLSVKSAEIIANKGIINDRYFKDNNEKDIQITMIETENIDYFNNKSQTQIPYIDFRRNIITKGISLNKLVGKKIAIGNVIIIAHRLCDPCKYLQDKLKEKNLFKNFSHLYNRGGLRCEIFSGGIISIKDTIKVL